MAEGSELCRRAGVKAGVGTEGGGGGSCKFKRQVAVGVGGRTEPPAPLLGLAEDLPVRLFTGLRLRE